MTKFNIDASLSASQQFAAMVDDYRRIADHVGATYPQLQPDWNPKESPVVKYYSTLKAAREYDDPTGRGALLPGDIKSLTEAQDKDDEQVKAERLKNLTIRIHGPLEPFWGVTARGIIDYIERIKPTTIMAIVDSPGGNLYEGLSLYHYLSESSAEVTTKNGALVASAAVLPFLAGSTRIMNTGTSLMTHAPYMAVFLRGDYDEFKRKSNDLLGRLQHGGETMLTVYAEVLNITIKKAREYIQGENWFTAQKAKDDGFSTVKGGKEDTGDGDKIKDDANAKALENLTLFHIGNLREDFMKEDKV